MTTHPIHVSCVRPSTTQGFSLIELLIALSLGISLSAMILQLLISESSLGQRVNRLLRERSAQQRTLALIRDDVQRSSRISATPQLEQHACNLAGRLPVLHLTTPAGMITYSVGAAPSAIWRGQVLMRCGPSYNLSGIPTVSTTPQNRVIIDALAEKATKWTGCRISLGESDKAVDLAGSSSHPFSACSHHQTLPSTIRVRLQQEFKAPPEGSTQLLNLEGTLSGST